MKQLTGVIILVLAIFSFQLSALAAEPLKIGILDLQRCIQESNEGKRAAESLRKKGEGMQAEFNKKVQEIADLEKEMEKQSLMLSDDAKQAKLDELNKKKRDINYLRQDMTDDMKKEETDARVALLNIVSGVVEKIAKDKKFDLITERANGGVLYVSKALDITDDVIAELNKVKP